MAALSLVFDLIGRDVSASRAFKNVGDEADRAGKKGGAAGNAIAGGMKLAAGALLGGGLIAGFKSLYDAAAESAKIGALTTQVIKSTGGAAGISAKQVGDLAGAIAKKTGVDDEAIQSGENLLLTFTNVKNVAGEGNDIFSQATKIMTDMSVALGTDASGSAIQLGKALNDPIKGVSALQRVGVSFTASQKDQIRTLVESGRTMDAQKIILGELSKEFGGAAEAAATPFGKLQQRLGDVAETLGAELIPYVNRFADFMMADVLPAVTDVGGVVAGTLGPALGLAVDGFKGIFDVVAAGVRWFSDLPGPIKAGAVALGLIVALRNPVTNFFETVALKAMYMGGAVKGAVTSFAGAKAAAGGLVSAMGGPLGLAITGATVGLGFLVSWLDKSSDASADAAGYQRTLADALKESKGAIDDNVRAIAAQQAADTQIGDSNLLRVAKDAGIELPRLTDALLGNRGAYDEVSAALLRYQDANTIKAADAQGNPITVLNDEAKAAEGARGAIDELSPSLAGAAAKNRLLAQATAETSGAAAAAKPAVDAFAAGLEESAKAADDAKKQTDMFKLSLDILTGANVSLIEVQSAFEASLDAAKGAVKDLGGAVLNQKGSLDLSSESGRKASDVLLDVRNSGQQLISTMISQGDTAEDVLKADANLRAGFIRSAGQMGINAERANHLADQILGIPAERETQIRADVKQAMAAIGNTQKSIDNMHGRDLTIKVKAAGRFIVNPSGGLQEFATGGFTGHGGKYDPAGIVHAGEYVFTKEETSRAGVGNLRKLAKHLRGYAAGGPVLPLNVISDTRSLEGTIASVSAAMKNAAPADGVGYGGVATQGAGALVAFGRLLQSMGARVSEHPLFGGVTPGAHVRGSKHYSGRAIDVNTRPGTSALEQRELDPLMAMARRAGFQVIWRAPGHFNHGHVASYKTGTPFVPHDGLAYLHQGERVVPAKENAALGGPIDLSDATIVKLARVMMQGADGRISANQYRQGVSARSS